MTWAGRGRDLGRKRPRAGRRLRRERAPEEAVDYVGERPWITSGRGHSGGWTLRPGREALRGDFAPGVLERPVGLSGPLRSISPINFTTTLEPCFTPISTINQGGRGGGSRNLLIRCRGPATASATKHVFSLEQTSVNGLSRSSYGETPPMGRGVRPPGAGPEMRPRHRPFLIPPPSWEGPPAAPIPALFALRTPHFWICKTC